MTIRASPRYLRKPELAGGATSTKRSIEKLTKITISASDPGVQVVKFFSAPDNALKLLSSTGYKLEQY